MDVSQAQRALNSMPGRNRVLVLRDGKEYEVERIEQNGCVTHIHIEHWSVAEREALEFSRAEMLAQIFGILENAKNRAGAGPIEAIKAVMRGYDPEF